MMMMECKIITSPRQPLTHKQSDRLLSGRSNGR
jgi:hypothetical protein